MPSCLTTNFILLQVPALYKTTAAAGSPLPSTLTVMSPQPPPYEAGSKPVNPDKRELPAGWIEQYDKSYNTWFYVNTRENPPKSSWEHPLGPLPPAPAPQSFAPPPGPPPPDNRGSPYQQGPYTQQPGYGGPSQAGWAYPSPQSPQGGWGQQPPVGYQQPGWGPQPGPYGWQQGPPPGQGYYGGPPPQQVVVVKEKDKKKDKYGHSGGGGGMGMGTVVAAGGAGLLGGVLLGEALDDHDYQEGFEDGANFDDDGGGW